ncbi:MAG: glutamate synthase [Alphaproteobacteria bacterium]
MADVETLILDCQDRPTRDINNLIRKAADDGVKEVEILNTHARHNIGVGILKPIHLIYRGHVGYYTVGLCDGVTAVIHGSAGWGVGDNLLAGEVVVEGNAATSAAPSIRGGRIVVKGNGGPRAGIYLKSGDLIIGGDAGYMSGFMMQNGRLIICGNAAKGLGDSMYQGQIWLGGEAEELGSGVTQAEPEAGELDEVLEMLEHYRITAPKSFKKLQSDRSLWHFNKHDFAAWKDVL